MENRSRKFEWRLLKDAEDPGFAEAWRIFDTSFPRCEKRSREHLAEALSDPLFLPYVLQDAEGVAAIAFCWRMPRALYLEHLAVDPARRNGRIGSQILERLAAEGLPLVLEIEPPEDELARRRCAFYRRNGFVANEYPYVHPSFTLPFEPHPLVLMSRPEPLTPAEAAGFERFVHERVLRYSDHRRVREK